MVLLLRLIALRKMASAARIEEVVVTDTGCEVISLFPAEELPILTGIKFKNVMFTANLKGLKNIPEKEIQTQMIYLKMYSRWLRLDLLKIELAIT